MREGEGEEVWKNGDKYIGQFSRDKMHGLGEVPHPLFLASLLPPCTLPACQGLYVMLGKHSGYLSTYLSYTHPPTHVDTSTAL